MLEGQETLVTGNDGIKRGNVHYWDTCGSPVIKHLCFFFVFFFFLCHKMEKLHNSTQWSLGNKLWSNEGECVHMLIMCVILMMTDIVMHRQGWVTWWTTRFLLIKLLCQPFCICFGVVVLAMEVLHFWAMITWSFMVQT